MSKSPSLRRIQADIRELSLDPSDQYYASPLDNDMFEWHFTIRGAPDTDFAGGMYHGRILLPPDYPFKPPHIVFLTPSGRFETHTKICLSFSAFHPELWQPAWGIRLILEALIAFLPSPADGAIGSLDWSATERKRLAEKSKDFCCPLCGKTADLLPPLKEGEAAKKPNPFSKEIELLQQIQAQEHKKDDKEEEKEKAFKPASAAEQGDDKEPPTTPTPNAKEPLTPDLTTEKKEELSPEKPAAPAVSASTAVENDPPSTPVPPQVPANAVPAPVVENNNDIVNEPAPQAAVANGQGEPQLQAEKPSWIVEPVMQTAIVVLSVICFLLLRKIQALLAELQALEE